MAVVPQIITEVSTKGVSITTVVDGDWVSVTSVNGMTGDVQVELLLEDFQANHFYRKNTAVIYQGALYYAKEDFNSGATFNASDWNTPSFVQEQADWTEASQSSNAYIKNKPTLANVATSGSYTDLENTPTIPTKLSELANDNYTVEDQNYIHTDNNFSTNDKNKLDSIEAGAEANIQSDWTQTDTSSKDYIKHKPTTLDFINIVYPVGSYYETSDASFDPNVAWGGTWDEDTGGKVLVAQDSGTFDIVGATGGSETNTHQHWQTSGADEGLGYDLAAQNDSLPDELSTRVIQQAYRIALTRQSVGTTATRQSTTYNTTISTLQPYIVVKRWHRVA